MHFIYTEQKLTYTVDAAIENEVIHAYTDAISNAIDTQFKNVNNPAHICTIIRLVRDLLLRFFLFNF